MWRHSSFHFGECHPTVHEAVFQPTCHTTSMPTNAKNDEVGPAQTLHARFSAMHDYVMRSNYS
jgi:hypothetical protein